jgi:hypothetical protein
MSGPTDPKLGRPTHCWNCASPLPVSYAAGIAMALAAPGQLGVRRLWLALTLPLYWPLQTIAMGRAIYGLARCPHFWAKTPHRPAGTF